MALILSPSLLWMIASATSPLSLAGTGPLLNIMVRKWPQSKDVSRWGEVKLSAAQSTWKPQQSEKGPCQDHSRDCGGLEIWNIWEVTVSWGFLGAVVVCICQELWQSSPLGVREYRCVFLASDQICESDCSFVYCCQLPKIRRSILMWKLT